jgi:hypothetical protein
VNEGVNFTPRGQLSPLGAKGEVKNGPQAPILPKVTNLGLQIFVTCAFDILVAFNILI